ncbi:MAG: hypothetical protein OXL40_04815 [Bacteroidota bacterium]|nr:hypothetical protein [Bacteroidota bacterium]
MQKERSCNEASTLIEIYEKMATEKAENIVARLEAKMDAQYSQIKWVIGIGLAVLALVLGLTN